LSKIPNLILLSVPESEFCCGSAGTYNLEQPETAQVLGQRKAQHLLGTGAEVVATGNIGCMTQLRNQIRSLGHTLPVWHTMEVLDRAYRSAGLTGGDRL
jgi:glycolate oxidase iron-sulfur subunit